jgi:Bacterial EndoU nuclease
MNLIALFLAFTAFVMEANAQAFFPQSKNFTVTRTCKATKSISGKDPVTVSVGKTFTAVGLNKTDGATHAYIKGNGLSGSRWIALSCGSFAPTPKPDVSTNPAPTGGLSGTTPFFDDINNPVSGLAFGSPADATPTAPVLDAFDRDVIAACGAPGTLVGYPEFRALMFKYPEILEATGLNIVQLSAVWFNAEGFNHIFCGEKVNGKLSGLHFAGRYLELQEKGLAGRLTGNLSKEEVIPGAVYTMGVKVKVGDEYLSAPIKGYGYTLSAKDIIRIGTSAYLANQNEGINKACNLPITDDGKSFTAVFVTKYGGIRTFYPDATPSGNPDCSLVEKPFQQG